MAGLKAVKIIMKFTGKGNIIEIKQIKHLNNILSNSLLYQPDHQTNMGFKAFLSALTTIAGVEVTPMIRKKQFAISGFCRAHCISAPTDKHAFY